MEKKFLFFVEKLNRFFSASAMLDVSMDLVDAIYLGEKVYENDLKFYWKDVLLQDIINIQSKNRSTVIGLPQDLIVKILPCILS